MLDSFYLSTWQQGDFIIRLIIVFLICSDISSLIKLAVLFFSYKAFFNNTSYFGNN